MLHVRKRGYICCCCCRRRHGGQAPHQQNRHVAVFQRRRGREGAIRRSGCAATPVPIPRTVSRTGRRRRPPQTHNIRHRTQHAGGALLTFLLDGYADMPRPANLSRLARSDGSMQELLARSPVERLPRPALVLQVCRELQSLMALADAELDPRRLSDRSPYGSPKRASRRSHSRAGSVSGRSAAGSVAGSLAGSRAGSAAGSQAGSVAGSRAGSVARTPEKELLPPQPMLGASPGMIAAQVCLWYMREASGSLSTPRSNICCIGWPGTVLTTCRNFADHGCRSAHFDACDVPQMEAWKRAQAAREQPSPLHGSASQTPRSVRRGSGHSVRFADDSESDGFGTPVRGRDSPLARPAVAAGSGRDVTTSHAQMSRSP